MKVDLLITNWCFSGRLVNLLTAFSSRGVKKTLPICMDAPCCRRIFRLINFGFAMNISSTHDRWTMMAICRWNYDKTVFIRYVPFKVFERPEVDLNFYLFLNFDLWRIGACCCRHSITGWEANSKWSAGGAYLKSGLIFRVKCFEQCLANSILKME